MGGIGSVCFALPFALCLLALGTETLDQQCSEEFAAKQQEVWANHYHGNVYFSACGAKAWLKRHYELMPNQAVVIFDIGCNKGYESGLMMSLFKPEAGVTANTLFKVHQREGEGLEGDLCGVCNNCNEHIAAERDSTFDKPVYLYCFEPSIVNMRNLRKAKSHVNSQLEAQGLYWRLIPAAVGANVAMVKFPRTCGSTLCQVAEGAAGPQHVATFMTSVDAFAEAEGLEQIDILKVDTEGHDPAVLFGSTTMLGQKRIAGLLYFEYHEFALWQTVTLKDVVALLDENGYDCYFEGTPTLTRLTGCWHEKYEFRYWSNVVCVNRAHWMAPELEAMTWIGEGKLEADKPTQAH